MQLDCRLRSAHAFGDTIDKLVLFAVSRQTRREQDFLEFVHTKQLQHVLKRRKTISLSAVRLLKRQKLYNRFFCSVYDVL